MSVGARIAERLAALGMSQSELARRTRLGQSTINGLVRGSSTSSTHLHRIARELGTTPAYLTGETDDPAGDAPDTPAIDSDSRELLELFESMSQADRRALMQVARSMGGPLPPKPTIHAPKLAFAGPPPRNK